MAQKRRFGTERSATRATILDATESVLIEDGYAAVTTRRVAEKAGLKAPTVHYYYQTTDDLLIAVYRRSAERSVQRHAEAMAQDDLLQALWEVNVDSTRTTLALEFLAMANHRKVIQEEIARYAEQIRAIQIVAINRFFRKHQLDPAPLSPAVLTIVLAGIARLLIMEDSVGIQLGHDETRRAVEDFLLSLARRPE